jgi:DNA repair protein RecO (recombination protein O)
MKFSDIGIIISQKKYAENSLIIKVFSQNHGIYSAFVKSIKSEKSKQVVQIGNLISFSFFSRIEENLGQFSSLDLINSYAGGIIFNRFRLDCFNSLISIIDSFFVEREENEYAFEIIKDFIESLTDEKNTTNFLTSKYVMLELEILKILGYGVDLSSCVVTNSNQDLAFVSPKSARAVSFNAGEKFADKLLKLPKFLIDQNCEYCHYQLLDGLNLSGFFLKKFLFSQVEQKHQNQFYNHRQAIEKSLRV